MDPNLNYDQVQQISNRIVILPNCWNKKNSDGLN